MFPLPDLPFSGKTGEKAFTLLPQNTRTAVTDSLIQVCIAEVNPDSIVSYMQHLENFVTRFALAGNRKAVALWIQQKFMSFGYLNARLDSFEAACQWPLFSGQYDTVWQYNVLASVEGSVNPAITCIAGGHYDAIVFPVGDPFVQAPGADDNASSTAAVMEIARILKLKDIVPDVTLVFAAWAAEEPGIHGSAHHVSSCLQNNIPVKAYFNLDMISNQPDSTPWRVNVNMYQGHEWLGSIAGNALQTYTQVTPMPAVNNSFSSDSYPFYLAGYPCVYFSEYHISPNYHKVTDLVANCNIPYCTEITRAALAAMLKTSTMPMPVQYELFNPGTGISLIAKWKPNPETDLAGYQVRLGTASGNYTQLYFTTDTTYNLSGLSSDTLYYVAVSAINLQGTEGPLTEHADSPVEVLMNQGILIVDDSEGTILNSSDSIVDAYYENLLAAFTTTQYDAFMAQEIGLADLGKYSAILWHVNKATSITVLNRFLPEVVKYLKLGGKILFSLYQPERAIHKLTAYPVNCTEGSFFRDYLGITCSDLRYESRFNRAVAQTGIPADLQVDSTKTLATYNYHLTYIESTYPADESQILFTYGTAYDTATIYGAQSGKAVAVASLNQDWKTVTLSFPLYYMQFQEAKAFVEMVMTDFFGQSPAATPVTESQQLQLRVWPNPAGEQISVAISSPEPCRLSLELYNHLGERCKSLPAETLNESGRCTINLTGLPAGLYFLRANSEEFIVSQKIMLIP